MSDMKKYVIVLFAAFFFTINSYSQNDTSYFKITKATSQGWAGGAAGSGSGINYVFNLVVKANVKIRFYTVWIRGDNALPIRFAQSYIKDSTVKNAYSLTLNAEHYFPGEVDRYNGLVNDNKIFDPPVKYDGKALLSFTIRNKTYYYAVKDMENLAPLYYP